MQISEHFTLDEMTFSSTALRRGIDNTPPEGALSNLAIAATGMELVRSLLGAPIHVNSGYRCRELNAAVGGAKHSSHMLGWAVDFVCPAFGTPLEIVNAIAASGIVFDKCIQEGKWVHISFGPGARKQILTAHFGTNGTTYTTGV